MCEVYPSSAVLHAIMRLQLLVCNHPAQSVPSRETHFLHRQSHGMSHPGSPLLPAGPYVHSSPVPQNPVIKFRPLPSRQRPDLHDHLITSPHPLHTYIHSVPLKLRSTLLRCPTMGFTYFSATPLISVLLTHPILQIGRRGNVRSGLSISSQDTAPRAQSTLY